MAGSVISRIPPCGIDICPEHGTWSDAHEFHKFVRALEHAREGRRRH
jgi:hypothetical protein